MYSAAIQRYFNEHIHLPYSFFLQPQRFIRHALKKKGAFMATAYNYVEPSEADNEDIIEYLATDFDVMAGNTVGRLCVLMKLPEPTMPLHCNDTHLQYGDDFQMLEVQNSEEAARLVIKNYLREVAIHGIENVQILSPFRKRGAVASNALNETIRDLVNPPNNLKKEVKCGSRVFRVGDRIMQTVNRINVSNGDVGIITDVETEDDDTIARVKLLDGRELSYTQEMLEDLEFSYCTTIHKSQGQEYPVIIVPLLKEHYTRSKKRSERRVIAISKWGLLLALRWLRLPGHKSGKA